MEDVKVLPIDKDSVPYRFNIKIASETFGFEVYYNTEADMFTVDLYKGNQLIRAGEKISYGRNMFGARVEDGEIITSAPDMPKAILLPIDPAGKATRVGWNELEESVFIYIFEGDL